MCFVVPASCHCSRVGDDDLEPSSTSDRRVVPSAESCPARRSLRGAPGSARRENLEWQRVARVESFFQVAKCLMRRELPAPRASGREDFLNLSLTLQNHRAYTSCRKDAAAEKAADRRGASGADSGKTCPRSAVHVGQHPAMIRPFGRLPVETYFLYGMRLARSGPEHRALSEQLSALDRRRRLQTQQQRFQACRVDPPAIPPYPKRPRPPS